MTPKGKRHQDLADGRNRLKKMAQTLFYSAEVKPRTRFEAVRLVQRTFPGRSGRDMQTISGHLLELADEQERRELEKMKTIPGFGAWG